MTDPSATELPEELHDQITKACADADEAFAADELDEARVLYELALGLIPSPIEDWEAATFVLASIGDVLFSKGSLSEARDVLGRAMHCPGALGNPFLHLRLGQVQLELGDERRAGDELTRAYMGGGLEVFAEEHPKYLRFLRTKITIDGE